MRTVTLSFLLGPYSQPCGCHPFRLSSLGGVPAAAGVILSCRLLGPLTQVAVAPLDLSDVGGAHAMMALCCTQMSK